MNRRGVIGRIVDVAPNYRTGVGPKVNGHYALYHDDLRRAAESLGVEWITFVERDEAPASGVVPCLDTADTGAMMRSLAKDLRPADLVVLYEGSIALLEAISEVARSLSSCRFLVNLFAPEAGLDGVSSRSPLGWSGPENVIVTAETDRRVDLARELGLPCVAAWQLHSAVHDVVVPRPEGFEGTPLRILVPLSVRGFSKGSVHDIAYVLARLQQMPVGSSIALTLTGADSPKPTAVERGERLASLGAQLVAGPADRRDYARLFADHDALWMPQRTAYATQSSGKTLDALVQGVPVLAFADTWPARQSMQWTGIYLGYQDLEQALGLLIWLSQDIGSVRSRLEVVSDALRSDHSPVATVQRILEVAGEVPPGSRSYDRDASESPIRPSLPPFPSGRLRRNRALRTARSIVAARPFRPTEAIRSMVRG
jgi:hypothetical protein